MKQHNELFFNLLQSSDKIIIIGHLNPDGDSVGSAVGMGRFLASIGKECNIVFPSKPSQTLYSLFFGDVLCFSDNTEERARAAVAVEEADLIICIDFNTIDRSDAAAPFIRKSSAKKVLIDHHPSPECEAFDLVFSDTEISSACEKLFWILMDAPSIAGDILKMDKNCAEALCTGLITDTNNFSNSIFPSTFRMASLLLERGIDIEDISRRFFRTSSENKMRLLGYMLDHMDIDKQLRSACMVLTRDIQRKFNFQTGDSEGFVNYGLNVEGIEVSALFTEEPEKIRVSLRSKGKFSVNLLSRRYFNGGGHEKASGGKLTIPISEVQQYFKESLKQFRTSITTLLIMVILSFAAIGCNEDRDNKLAQQESYIESYIKSNYADKPVTKRNGSNQVLVNRTIFTSDSLMYGDTLIFYYAGYIFGSSGPTSIFATNVESVAESASFILTDPDYTEIKVAYNPGVFIEGLTEGLYGVRTGDHCVIIFTAKYGFDTDKIGTIPSLSALMYDVWIDKVIKQSL